MARIRTIKPEFWADEKLGPMDALTRLVFLGLVSMADDAGRLVDSERQIEALLFPYTDDTVREPLANLARAGRIVRGVTASGQRIIQLANWHHQKVDHPNLKAALPPIAQPLTGIREPLATDSRGIRDSISTSDQLPTTSDQRPTTVAASPDVQRLLDGLPNDAARMAWSAEIEAAREGLRGTQLTQEQIDRACRDYVGNGNLASPSLRHFRAFLASAGRAPGVRLEPAESPTAGEAGQVFAAIRALITEKPNPGRGMIRLIPKAKVQELGPVAVAAYEQIGGADRFLEQGEKIGFLLRDFTQAYNSAQRATA